MSRQRALARSHWMAYNTAHDVALPQSKGEKRGFFMYPTAENAESRFNSYAPDDFNYQITAKEIKALFGMHSCPPGQLEGQAVQY